MRLVLFGPQGAGKGTQSARISEKYDVPAIATGDMFRWAMSHGTDVGRQAQEYVRSGRLVPDELTIEIVRKRLDTEDSEDGFLLDGFPRNLKQAETLDEILRAKATGLNAALALEVPEQVSLHRLLGRRVCADCGRNYSVDSPPKEDWTCDRCGGHVERRFDDEDEATITERLKLYHSQTEPLKAYYQERGVLRAIEGVGSQDEVFQRIMQAV